MENFIFQNPTKLVFGKGTIARLGELIPAGKRVMVTFGGGSVRRNGVYDEVCAALAGRDTVEFWGIEPNPSIETLREAIALGKEREVDFLLAVGGGSVIDGTKPVSYTHLVFNILLQVLDDGRLTDNKGRRNSPE